MRRLVGYHDDPRFSARHEGTRDAIRDYRRRVRTPYPDAPDFFGVRLSDSTDGDRYVSAYNWTMRTLINRYG
jgi:hypothetical protein